MINTKASIFLLFALTLLNAACKKAEVTAEDVPVSPTSGTRTQFTLDSIYLYANQIYLWSDALPSYGQFNPRGYTAENTAMANFKKELFTISQLKLNPANGEPFELTATSGLSKYSYLENGNSKGLIAATGTSNQAAVLKTNLFTIDGEQIAYIAFGSFPVLTNSKTAIDNALLPLAAADPRYIIIDLRSNGGGYVETAEYVANLVAGSALNGKVMYTGQYNTLLQNGKASILKNQLYYDSQGKTVLLNGRNATMADVDFTTAGNTCLFSKKGTMENITEICFIVSAQTASASELLISILKPYFKIKIIGQKTYGKPVGFFPVNIDTYSVYIPSFILKNSLGWSDYYNGITPDISVNMIENPVLGDVEEVCLKAALTTIKTGLAKTTQVTGLTGGTLSTTINGKAAVSSLQSSAGPASAPAKTTALTGMIETRYHLRKQD